MKNSIRYHIVKALLLLTLLFLIVEFIMQIGLSAIFSNFDHTSFIGSFIDISAILWGKNGELTIYYTDIVRIGCFLVVMIPYACCILNMIDVQVVRPLRDIVSEIQKIDGNKLDYRLEIPTAYEFTEVKIAFHRVMERLEIADKQKNMLITGMAHDLKTPVTTIRGYSQALTEGVIVEESKKREYLLAIHRKSIKLDELISILFDYSQLMTVQKIPTMEYIDLIELIKENIGLFYTDFEEKNINFVFNLPDKKVSIKGDLKELNRVFSNIYTNALKHNKAGDTVYTEIEEKDDIIVYIRDTGDRIPENMAEHIFEPFVMGDTSRKTGGSGLGLSIASKIMELHHGSLTLEQKEESPYTKSFVICFYKEGNGRKAF